MLIRGRCHCGNISFALDWTPDPAEIPARVCDCSFCVRHGGTWTSWPAGSLSVAVRDASLHSRYAFGTETATFHVCARCGGVPVVTSAIDGNLYAVVSVTAMENVDPALIKRRPMSFGVEDAASRLARRKAHWIGRVRFDGSG